MGSFRGTASGILVFAASLLSLAPSQLYAQDVDADVPPAHLAIVDGTAMLARDTELDSATVGAPLIPGDRVQTTSGRVEIVYAGTAETLWLSGNAPAGDACAGQPCWKGLGAPPLTEGVEYADRERTPNGIGTLVLSAKPPRTRIKLRARGPLLGMPPLGSLELPVRVQIQRTGAACWEATFDTLRLSTSDMFKAVVK